MVKPIFIVGVSFINDEHFNLTQKSLQETLGEDYYCIVYLHNHDTPHFQVFYEKDFNEVKYEELKQLVGDLITSNNKK
jgi:hypothetical protein